ncbi:unnamed protein product [Chrysoparadoxa australica]
MVECGWFFRSFPKLVKAGFGDKVEAFVTRYPPESTNVAKWRAKDLLEMIKLLGLEDLEPDLRDQEFLPEDENEESPFGYLDASELAEVFEESQVAKEQVDMLKVALRYLKGEFTNVSIKA